MKREFKVEGVENANPNEFGGMCSRATKINRADINFDSGIATVATTEAPALVIDWERWQVIREILPMQYAEMPMNDKAPLLDCHCSDSVEEILGSAMNWGTSGTELNCNVFVSASEMDVRQKISEGHIDSVSIGYLTDKNYSVEVPKGASVTVDGISYKNEYEDGYPLIVRTWWKTKELSLVPIGADEAAKFKAGSNIETKKIFERLDELSNEIKDLKSKKGKSKSFYERKLRMIESEINN